MAATFMENLCHSGTALYARRGRVSGDEHRRRQLQFFSQNLHPFTLRWYRQRPAWPHRHRFFEKNATSPSGIGAVALRYLHGIITGVELQGEQPLADELPADCFALPGGPDCARTSGIFQQQDIQTISATLLAENDVTGLGAFLFMSPIPPKWILRAVWRNWTSIFLSRLWAEEGIFSLTGSTRPVPTRNWCSAMTSPGLHTRRHAL